MTDGRIIFQVFWAISLLLSGAWCVAAENRLPAVVPLSTINAEVSLDIAVTASGAIEGTMRNNTGRKIGDVEVLVEYAWIWANDQTPPRDNPSWSTTYTLPVELLPDASVPLNITPSHAMSDRDDGHYLISAKVVGYTRYRWVTPNDLL